MKDIETPAAGGTLAPTLKHQIKCLHDIPPDDRIGESPPRKRASATSTFAVWSFRISLRQSALGAELQRLGVSEAHLGRVRAMVVGHVFVRSVIAQEQAFGDYAKGS